MRKPRKRAVAAHAVKCRAARKSAPRAATTPTRSRPLGAARAKNKPQKKKKMPPRPAAPVQLGGGRAVEDSAMRAVDVGAAVEGRTPSARRTTARCGWVLASDFDADRDGAAAPRAPARRARSRSRSSACGRWRGASRAASSTSWTHHDPVGAAGERGGTRHTTCGARHETTFAFLMRPTQNKSTRHGRALSAVCWRQVRFIVHLRRG